MAGCQRAWATALSDRIASLHHGNRGRECAAVQASTPSLRVPHIAVLSRSYGRTEPSHSAMLDTLRFVSAARVITSYPAALEAVPALASPATLSRIVVPTAPSRFAARGNEGDTMGIWRPNIPLPSHWPEHARAGIIHAIALAHFGLTHIRGWCENSRIERVKLRERLLLLSMQNI